MEVPLFDHIEVLTFNKSRLVCAQGLSPFTSANAAQRIRMN